MYEITLKNRTAVVTGAATGIGLSIVKTLLQAGARVVMTDLHESVLESAQTLQANGYDCHAHVLDVTQSAEVNAVVDWVERRWPITDWLNNAGVSTMQTLQNLTDQDWHANLDVNLTGTFLCTRAVLPRMIERRSGHIVNTASMAGLKGVPLLAHYSASKWGVVGLTKSVAQEVAPYGVTVNAVCPGFVATSMQSREIEWEGQLRNLSSEEVLSEYVGKTPLGRIEDPQDVANAVLFLLSDLASFITGVALPVTGGADLV